MRVRTSSPSDWGAISACHLAAFDAHEGPVIVDLVSALFKDETASPYLSLVAASGRQIAGHILFTAVRVRSPDHAPSASILAPLGVAPSFQGQGVGGLLIRSGLERLAESEVDLVFVLGHPHYYPRHGFQPAGDLGLDAPYTIPEENAEAWMVQELRPGVLGRVQGTVECATVLSHPELWRE